MTHRQRRTERTGEPQNAAGDAGGDANAGEEALAEADACRTQRARGDVAGESNASDVESTDDLHDDADSTDGASDDPIDFLALAGGRREVLVRLAGQTYRLRWTRNDKLILTK